MKYLQFYTKIHTIVYILTWDKICRRKKLQ